LVGPNVEKPKSIAEWMDERGLTLEALLDATPLDRKVVKAIVNARYTPSPQQRRTLAAALGVAAEMITWGHTSQVQHIHGHGPQFGRSP
jgi:hypothetical protein